MGRIAHLSYATTLCFAAACAPATDADVSGKTQSIIEGDVAADDQWQSVGMLIAKGKISENGGAAQLRVMGLCTATLISPTAVLTAEHCVNQQILKQSVGQRPELSLEGDVLFDFTFARKITEVQAGTAKLLEVESIDQSESFAPISNPIAAFQPAPAKWDDIAIVHLKEAVVGRRLQPLATKEIVDSLTIAEGSMYRAAGYGLTNDKDDTSAGTLTSGLSHLDDVGDHEITAGDGDRQQACRGDSGGPLFSDETDRYQIGIASRVNIDFEDILNPPDGDDGEPNEPGKPPPCKTGLAYTRVDAYLDWIAERVPDLPTPGTGGGDGSVGDGDGDGAGDGAGDGDGDGSSASDGSSDDGAAGDGDGDGDGTPPRKGDDGCSVTSTPSTGLAQLIGFAGLFTVATVRRRRRSA